MEAFYQALNSLGYTHPVHPTLIYLPIGGVMAAFIFGILSVLLNRSSLAVSARHSIVLAFFGAFPTIFFGYTDWQYFHGGAWMFPIIMKIILAGTLIVLLLFTLLSHWKFKAGMKIILPLYTLCFINVVAIGYYGGEIVFGGADTQHRHTASPEEETAKGSLPQKKVSWNEVSRIFEQHCTMCHTGSSAPLGLQLNSYEQVMAGSNKGEVVIPGKPGESELVLRIKGLSEPAMPYRQPSLSEDTIQTIVRWVELGAPPEQQRKN